MCRMGKHVVKCEPSLPPAVSRDRAWWTQTCGEIRISCGHVRRDRTGRTSKHVAKCEFGDIDNDVGNVCVVDDVCHVDRLIKKLCR